jgi:hypothetical protein
MVAWTLTLLLLVRAAPVPLAREAPPGTSKRLAQAEALYAQREDLARLREGIRLLQEAHASDPASFEADWRLAKYDYYLGAHSADEKERDAAFSAGAEAGRAAVRLSRDRPEGHFWLGANLGGRAQAKGTLGGLAAVSAVRKEMEAVIRADPGYQDGSAYMVLAQIELRLPGLLGGDKRHAVELLEAGLRYGGLNALLRLRLAEAYLASHKEAEARTQLAVILAMQPPPDYVPEYKEAAAEARKLLAAAEHRGRR